MVIFDETNPEPPRQPVKRGSALNWTEEELNRLAYPQPANDDDARALASGAETPLLAGILEAEDVDNGDS